MTGVLFRTDFGQFHSLLLPGGSPRTTIFRHGSFFGSKKQELSQLLYTTRGRRIIRAISEPWEIIRPRQTFLELYRELLSDIPISIYNGRDGDGIGCGGSNNSYNDNSNDDDDDDDDNGHNKIGAHYKKMLKSHPNDPLFLRNYGKFLQEVEGDVVKAEEYYGRAIVASPGDGDLLSLYGKLIWDTQRDEDRAQSYFDQAVKASPDDYMVMGSYAHFLWEAEEEQEQEEEDIFLMDLR